MAFFLATLSFWCEPAKKTPFTLAVRGVSWKIVTICVTPVTRNHWSSTSLLQTYTSIPYRPAQSRQSSLLSELRSLLWTAGLRIRQRCCLAPDAFLLWNRPRYPSRTGYLAHFHRFSAPGPQLMRRFSKYFSETINPAVARFAVLINVILSQIHWNSLKTAKLTFKSRLRWGLWAWFSLELAHNRSIK